jgi:hypothetical protein
VCILSLLQSSLVCLFWTCESLEVSLAGRVIFFFLCGAPLCGMSVRYNLFERQPGVGGRAVQVFFFWALLWWVWYDLFECWPGVGGGAVQVFFWYYLSVLCFLSC